MGMLLTAELLVSCLGFRVERQGVAVEKSANRIFNIRLH